MTRVRPIRSGPGGIARYRRLWGLWRKEKVDPEPFYNALAAEVAVELGETVGPLSGQVIADLGCGPGFYARALREVGAEVIPVDNSIDELSVGGEPPEGFLLADAAELPLDTGSVDGVFCSNLLEHCPNSPGVLREISRILRAGGWAYVSWTNWFSPWGGHDMAPYHFLGPKYGPALYERRHGPPRKNRINEGLWPVHIGPTLRLLRQDPSLDIVSVKPRYWPRLAVVMKIPGAREVLAWNCLIYLRKRPVV